MKTINETLEFIKEAHKGQIDKSGIEYWKHPLQVMLLLPPNATITEQYVALLHDVLEDTEYTEKDLLNLGYTQQIVDAVKLVSRDKNQTYNEFINSIIDSNNITAIVVKITDMVHNMSEERFEKLSEENKIKQNEINEKRYKPNMKKLANKLVELVKLGIKL